MKHQTFPRQPEGVSGAHLQLVPPAKTWDDYLAEGREFVRSTVRPGYVMNETRLNDLARGWAIINAPIGVFAAHRGGF